MSEGLSFSDVREHWATKSKPWTKWADTVAPMAARFNEHLIKAADIKPGMSVVDIASGAGEPVLSLPALVGEQGNVFATDIVGSMLSGLKSRDGAQPLLMTAADIQQLPFRNDRIDRVTCRFGLMFVPDPEQGMKEVARVLRPGGRAAFMVWGPRSDQTLFTLFADAIDRVLGLKPDEHHFQIFRFGAENSLTPIFGAAGLSDIEEYSIRFSPMAPLDRPFWRPQLDMSFGHVLEQVDNETRAAIDDAIRALLEPTKTPDGYPMTAHIRIAVGVA